MLLQGYWCLDLVPGDFRARGVLFPCCAHSVSQLCRLAAAGCWPCMVCSRCTSWGCFLGRRVVVCMCVVFGRAYRYVDGTAMCLAGCNTCLLAGAAAVTPGAACCALHLSCMLAHAVWMEGTCLCRPEVAGVSMRLPAAAASFGRCRAPWHTQNAADAAAPTATVCGADEMSSLLMRHAHVT